MIVSKELSGLDEAHLLQDDEAGQPVPASLAEV